MKKNYPGRRWLYLDELTWWERLTLSKEIKQRYKTGVGFDQAKGDPHGSLSRVGQWSREYRRIDRMPFYLQAEARFKENKRVERMYCPCNRRPVIDNPYRCELHIEDEHVEPDPNIQRNMYDGFR